jgi:KUP system potassium uptake protein
MSAPDGSKSRIDSGRLVGALGVVFGDIGTSPLYAFKESVHVAGVSDNSAIGIASLIIWVCLLVVGIKYVLIVMRADNQGEGGTIALLAFIQSSTPKATPPLLLIIGLSGASLFFGDAMITPAISVLSAVEGVRTLVPGLGKAVVPITCLILVALFYFQQRGSASIGRLFGPVMLVWFGTIASAGVVHISRCPSVLFALNPLYGYRFLIHGPGIAGFLVLGSVFLAVTGGEALYADMGHFGRRSIRLNWFVVVFPALALNYLGQAALTIANPGSAGNSFFSLFSPWLLYLIVPLATVTTVIASQAVISGAFTLVHQAIQMGHIPRLTVRHTSRDAISQVYLPQVNWILASAVVGLVIGFGSSSALANAYGIAVAGDMLATTVLIAALAGTQWGIFTFLVVAVASPFLLLDAVFIASNIHKVPQGGWFPLLVGSLLLVLSLTWRKGRRALLERQSAGAEPLSAFLISLSNPNAPYRTAGSAIYLTRSWHNVPAALALNLRHSGVLHQNILLLKLQPERVPRVIEQNRLEWAPLGHGINCATLKFGFADEIDIPASLRAHRQTLGLNPDTVSFFVSRSLPVSSIRPDLSAWEEVVFGFLSRNAVRLSDFVRIPEDQVVELGTRVEL